MIKLYIFISLVIDVASGEYGHEFLDRMVEHIDNGHVINWKPSANVQDRYEKHCNFKHNVCASQQFPQFEEEINPDNLKFKCSSWQQFCVLIRRESQHIYRNKVRLIT